MLNHSIALISIILLIGIVSLLARHRPFPNLAERAPERGIALREMLAMWIYGAVVLSAGRVIGQHYFGEGLALHSGQAMPGSICGLSTQSRPT